MSFLSDTPAANIFRRLFGREILRFQEEQPDFDLDEATRSWERIPAHQIQKQQYFVADTCDDRNTKFHPRSSIIPATPQTYSEEYSGDDAISSTINPEIVLVDWYSSSDPMNPENWSFKKKFWVYFVILYVSTAVYMSASIYSAAQDAIAEEFNISSTVSSLGLGLYVFGYGVGPMFLSPPSELPSVGRNTPYVAAMMIYVLISIPMALATNIPTLLVLRFFQGFFGSPLLTTGGATLGEISNDYNKPYAFYSLAMFSLGGPALGIIIAGFSVPVLGWRWSLWEIILATGPGFIILLFLPETSHANILLRRAERIRILSRKSRFISKSEIDAGKISMITRLHRSLVVPWKLNIRDPSISFTSLYCGLVYAIFYSFFEFFPLVYGEIYRMNLGQIGLVFTSVLIAVFLAGIPYALFVHLVVNRSAKAGRPLSPEGRLLSALFASVLVPSGLMIFAWTSRPEIHWIVPTIGSMLVSGNVVIIIQSVFVYITMSYPQYTASLFSGNGLVRCSVAFAGVVWSRPLYYNMGVNWGMTLMSGCCVLCIIGVFVLYFYGHLLRARSRFAD